MTRDRSCIYRGLHVMESTDILVLPAASRGTALDRKSDCGDIRHTLRIDYRARFGKDSLQGSGPLPPDRQGLVHYNTDN